MQQQFHNENQAFDFNKIDNMENLNEQNNNFKYIQFPENKKSLQNEIRFNM